jgi:hypothetical protein
MRIVSFSNISFLQLEVNRASQLKGVAEPVR